MHVNMTIEYLSGVTEKFLFSSIELGVSCHLDHTVMYPSTQLHDERRKCASPRRISGSSGKSGM